MIRAVLVDDEPPARRKLRHLLSSEPDIEIAGEAGSGAQAVEVLNRVRPDLALLDIQLPDCSGFDVVHSLASREDLHLVFVTAHDSFALKAFDAHAIDYLLKPVEPKRFSESIQRVRRMVESPDTSRIASKLDELARALRPDPAYVRRLLVQDNGRGIFLEVSRIDWLQAARITFTFIRVSAPTSCALAWNRSKPRWTGRSSGGSTGLKWSTLSGSRKFVPGFMAIKRFSCGTVRN